jgi:hypothetical protein
MSKEIPFLHGSNLLFISLRIEQHDQMFVVRCPLSVVELPSEETVPILPLIERISR